MSSLTPTTGIQQVDATLRALTDATLNIEDRAAAYGVIHQVQLRMNRALKAVKDELIVYMETASLRKLGPLSVSSSSIDPEYVCNRPENFEDYQTQEALAALRGDSDFNEYVSVIPAHLEIAAAKLGADVHAGIPQARQLFEQLKTHGWRKDSGRRLSLKVDEAKPRQEAA